MQSLVPTCIEFPCHDMQHTRTQNRPGRLRNNDLQSSLLEFVEPGRPGRELSKSAVAASTQMKTQDVHPTYLRMFSKYLGQRRKHLRQGCLRSFSSLRQRLLLQGSSQDRCLCRAFGSENINVAQCGSLVMSTIKPKKGTVFILAAPFMPITQQIEALHSCAQPKDIP